jgi:hypothetical protein
MNDPLLGLTGGKEIGPSAGLGADVLSGIGYAGQGGLVSEAERLPSFDFCDLAVSFQLSAFSRPFKLPLR